MALAASSSPSPRSILISTPPTSSWRTSTSSWPSLAIFGVFAGTYFWFPKMFGRMMNDTLGKWHFWLTFIGVYCIFMPMHYLGLAGNVRRYSAFVDDYLIPLIPVHKFITIAALATGAAQLIFLYNLIYSRFWGPIASENPWEATSLEWSTSSPPPFDNFGGRHMVVYNGPNEYGIDEGAQQDYVMQTSPPTKVPAQSSKGAPRGFSRLED